MNIKEKNTNLSEVRTFEVWVEGTKFTVKVCEDGVPFIPNHPEIKLPENKDTFKIIEKKPSEKEVTKGIDGNTILTAPIPGVIHELCFKPGDTVKAGQTLVVLEAMKMYNNLCAPCDLKVIEYPYPVETNVAKDAILCIFEIL